MMEQGSQHVGLLHGIRVDFLHRPAAVDQVGAVGKAQHLVDFAGDQQHGGARCS